ncbi:LysM peptidoglycan-binding and 3D domain-containing protein [Solibacillus sp. FSL H8-0538]|uniref:LysM peptidoglycan-binding and 3D domain-containing protein n=1 Tax=Solibacillus sp. FSL H8-0538 TaxID=2921400 RepID=UPI0030FB0486
MNKKLLALATIFTLSAGGFSINATAATHSVERGESLWSISQEYNMTVDELKELNSIGSNTIYPEQSLHVDGEGTAYLIEEGNSLFTVSLEHNVEVEALAEWNDVNTDVIVTGETLAVTEPVETTTAPAQPTAKQTSNNASKSTTASNTMKIVTMEATAYTAYCEGCSGITANGTDLRANPDLKVIAVDPKVIPLGTKVWVEGYGEAIAADTGGAIKGNKIDLFMPHKSDAYTWGRKSVTVKILD